jgi:disease resistance protein RPM1
MKDYTPKELKPWFIEWMQITHGQLMFLAIIGFGGIGKATLTMTMYHS